MYKKPFLALLGRAFCRFVYTKQKFSLRNKNFTYINIYDRIHVKSTKGGIMGYSYNKLWKLLIDNNMNKVTLRKKAGLSTTTLARLSKNEKVSLDAIAKICDTLECNIGDIVDYIREEHIDKN